jgi:hypothetical protein
LKPGFETHSYAPALIPLHRLLCIVAKPENVRGKPFLSEGIMNIATCIEEEKCIHD